MGQRVKDCTAGQHWANLTEVLHCMDHECVSTVVKSGTAPPATVPLCVQAQHLQKQYREVCLAHKPAPSLSWHTCMVE
jgi:hypothetical protein